MEFIKKNKKILITIMIIILILFIIFLLMVNGYIIPTKIEAEKFEVKGVDVSEYQGEVDWDKIKEQNIDFAFIKATEGSKGKDDSFDKNYEKLKNMDMLLGLYHFFSFESLGEEQADNYIKVVGNIKNDESLILPIIDIEYYSYYKKAKPDKEWVTKELQKMLEKLEKTYRVKPIIYTTMEFYKEYIESEFLEYDIWIRNILTKPKLENRDWKFWQYTGRGRLEGYNGEEEFIDLNVFNGSKEDFENHVKSKREEKKNNFNKEEQEKIEKEENTIKSIYNADVINIEENNTYEVKTSEGEILKVTLNFDDNNDNNKYNIEVINRRTEENINISNGNNNNNISDKNIVKVNDKLGFENVYIRKGEIVFTNESKIYLTRKISGEELKKEMLKGEINFDLEDIKKSGNNYILKGETIDWYFTTKYEEAEKFKLEIIVNNKTNILGEQGKIEEKIENLNGTLYITLEQNELKKGKLVATNIEVMGC